VSSPISSLRILPAESNLASLQSPSEPKTGFREMIRDAIDDVEHLQRQAETNVAGVLEGGGTDVHTAMIAVEKADLSFQLMMQVRNKIVSAYQEISRMQF
jgi:flagellar hook-basal body complex protein FliE